MNSRIEQLQQLVTATWDGNVISKTDRDELHKARLIQRHNGWTWINTRGLDVLLALKLLTNQTTSIHVNEESQRWWSTKVAEVRQRWWSTKVAEVRNEERQKCIDELNSLRASEQEDSLYNKGLVWGINRLASNYPESIDEQIDLEKQAAEHDNGNAKPTL